MEDQNAQLRKKNQQLAQELAEAKRRIRALERNIAASKQLEEIPHLGSTTREELEMIIDNIPALIAYVNDDQRYVYVNQAYAEWYARSKNAIIGKLVQDVIHEESYKKAAPHIQRALQGETIVYENVAYIDQQRHIVRASYVPHITKDNEVKAFLALIQDITTQHEAEQALRESEALYRSVVENAHAGIFIIDNAYKFTYLNKQTTQILGYTREEVLHEDFRRFLDEESLDIVADRYVRRQRGETVPVSYEIGIIRKDGERRDVQLHATVVRDTTGTTRTIGQILDITERKRSEDALRKYAKELEFRNKDLDAFAHTVAHDLKSSLSILIGFAEVLETDLESIPDEDLKYYLHLQAQKGRKMDNIIDELLLLSGLRQLQPESRPLRMGAIIQEAQQRLADMIEKYDATLHIPNDWPVAWGHGPWIEEIWINYLSNAIKYGGPSPHITLGAKVESEHKVRFWVRDLGIGLKPEEQARLFTPFTQVEPSRATGHGLGLSIVQRIVHKLGGDVGVESAFGQGSTFSFTLPRYKAPR